MGFIPPMAPNCPDIKPGCPKPPMGPKGLHMPFVAHVVQVHDVHVAHSGDVDSSIPSNNSTPRQWSATEHAHGRQLHVHVHDATLPSHAVGVREVAPHARSAKSGAHIAVAHSLVGDHQPSGSGDTRQSKEVNL